MGISLLVMLGLIVFLIFFRDYVGWILLGTLFFLYWLWKIFWKILAAPFRFIWWFLHEIERQWYYNDFSVFFAKVFTTVLVIFLAFKAFHLLVK